MEALDITSEGLRGQGYILKKEHKTMALYQNGSLLTRSDFDKNKWNSSVDKFEKKMHNESVPRIIISNVLADMSSNYDKLTNGSAAAVEAEAKAQLAATKTPMNKLTDIAPEDWQTQLSAKYNVLQDTIQNSIMPLPQLKLPLEFALSIKNILNLAEDPLPFAGFLLGAPSSLKTLAVELFRTYWHVRYRDDFSSKAFVSHYSGLTEEALQKNDLLPQVRFKLFLTPELAPLFTGNEDDIQKAFGLLTRLLDGKGLETHSGTQGGRGYHGDYMFVWLGAVVDVSSRVHRMMGNLGPKMYFLRLPKSYHKQEHLKQQIQKSEFVQDLVKIQSALIDYLKWFEASPSMYEKNGLPKMTWNNDENDANAITYINRLAELIGPLRGVAEVQDTEDSSGSSYAYSNTIVEEPWRANLQLYNLARGHALIEGRNYITMADIPLLIKVVLSTAPIARVAVFQLLLAHKGTLRTADIENALGISPNTVHKTMREFELLGLVDMEKDGSGSINSPLSITLKSQFRWCLGRRFQQLRESFSPTRKARKQPQMGKRSSNRGDNVDKDSTKYAKISGDVIYHDLFFWEVFATAEAHRQPEPNGTVYESEVKRMLISSGKFDAGEATQLINEMIARDLLRRLEFDILVKTSQANMSKSDEN